MQNKNNNTKILFTGGHAGSTALATIEKLQGKFLDIYFIGGKSSLEGKNSRTLAQVAFSDMGVKVYNLTSGRLQTKFSFWTLPSLFKIPVGFMQAFRLVKRIRPVVTVSFGGYAAFPVVVSSWLLGIPVIVHEQTSVAGRSNRASSFFASRIALARTSSLRYFPKGKCVVTGNPIPSNIKTFKKRKINSPPNILVTGGASGSRAINSLIESCLPKLLERYNIVHQTGDLEYDHFIQISESLPPNLKHRYKVFSVISPREWGGYLEWADIFVSRSGANFTYQLLIIKKPAVLIPLPFTNLDEQVINAKYAKDYGLAEIIDQKNITSEKLITTLAKIEDKWEGITNSVQNKVSPDLNASENLVKLIEDYLPNN